MKSNYFYLDSIHIWADSVIWQKPHRPPCTESLRSTSISVSGHLDSLQSKNLIYHYLKKKRKLILNIAFKQVKKNVEYDWLIKSTYNILTCMRFYSNQFNSILRWKHVEGFEFSATSRQRSFFPSKSTLNTTKKNLNFMYSELRIIS